MALPKKRPSGPEPEVLKIDADWKDAVKEALRAHPGTPSEPKKLKKPRKKTGA